MSADHPSVETLQAEIAALRATIAELEQHAGSLRVFRQTTDAAADAIAIFDTTGTITYANDAFRSMFGYTSEVSGTGAVAMLADGEAEMDGLLKTLSSQGALRTTTEYLRQDGTTFTGTLSLSQIKDAEGQTQAYAAISRDLSEQRKAEEERTALQEQVIDAQRAALREVSTPLIPLADDVVVMPLVGAIDSARAQQIMEVLLEGIAQYQADTVLLDISGVRVVDTQVADALLRAARAVQLLGAQIILTGISADVAQTIVHLGADMGQIMTRANLQDGLRYALEERMR